MMLQRSYFALVLIAAISILISTWWGAETAQTPADAHEEAYQANNLGVALLEQFKYKEGAEQFRRALALNPVLKLARINLAIALYNVPDLAGARDAAQAAAALAPAAPQPVYILGLIARKQNRVEDAAAAFERVLKLDPRDVGAHVHLGQLYAQQRKYAEATAAFRTALAEEPYNGTALYNLGTALLRSGQREEGQRAMQQFQSLRQTGAATTIGQNYLEQGRYSEAVASTGMEPDLINRATPEVSFKDATASTLPAAMGAAAEPGGGVRPGQAAPDEKDAMYWVRVRIMPPTGETLFDFDGDGDLDLFECAGAPARLYRNDAGKLADVTARAGAFAQDVGRAGVGCVAGDFDNDEKPDLFVLRLGALSLYRNEGGGRFTDVSTAAKLPAYMYLSLSAAFVDADHDGDLDIFVAGLADLARALPPAAARAAAAPSASAEFAGAPNLLLRNNGDGTFADVTAAAKVTGGTHAVAVVPTDYDNRRDVDLLVLNYGAAPQLYRNLRDGSFRDVAAEVGLDLQGNFACVAAGDVNKDDFTDFFFGRADAPGVFATSDGRGRFAVRPAPAATSGALAAQYFDYDNDGLLDLFVVVRDGVSVLRNVGDSWVDVSERATSRLSSAARQGLGRALASGDVDGDGDIDMFVRVSAGTLRFWRNEGGERNRSVRVRLAGKVSNRSGVGAKIELRAGSLRQQLETYAAAPAPAPASITFGLGQRAGADAVRILWPSGVVQAETELARAETANTGAPKKPTTAVTLPITELDRKPSSCPYLYTWNGTRFEFITDFMGGGEMGYLEEPGRYNKPDPDEYVRIRGDQLQPRQGRYELRVTNELEETLFVDRLQLIAVAHPQGVEVYPNEGMTDPPRPFILYKTRGAHPPHAAVDEHGHDVLARITHLDRQYPDDFRRARIRGYADEHALTLTLDTGGLRGRRTLLLLTGWTDYAWSSDNVAAKQAGQAMRPPALQVRDARGAWRTVIADIGIPVGRPQTVTVDLTGKFLSASREVRIVTNMRILWDQILVDTSGGAAAVQLTRLNPVSANLRWRGFSRAVTPDGREPYGYDYAQVSSASPWKVMPGHYTRTGDVRALLLKSDDIFVISRPGDELSLSFDAAALAPLPRGWTRTFLLYADGFSKEMDINSASPDQVSPMPFHGMTKYPYAAPESYPLTAARRAYIERYNTRLVAAELPSIDSVLLNAIGSRPGADATRAGGRK